MSKYPVHSVKPSRFYLKFWNAGRKDEKPKVKQPGAESSVIVSLQWIWGLWFRTSRHRAGTSTAMEWAIYDPGALTPEPHNLLWVFPHSPQSLSFPDWESARYQEHWAWQTAKSLCLTHCTDPIKGLVVVFYFFFWTAHPHFIAHFNTYAVYYIDNPVGLGWKQRGTENYKDDYSFTWNRVHWARVTAVLQGLYWVCLQIKFILV